MSIMSTLFGGKRGTQNCGVAMNQQPYRVGEFEKISYTQYTNDALKLFPNSEEEIKKSYDEIILPSRATAGSAGFDLHTPTTFVLNSCSEVTIPTGIRVKINPGWFLMIVPRSGLGFKWYLRLANTTGIIDSDYYYANNEGHIMAKIRRETDMGDTRPLVFNSGDSIAQCIFVPYGITFSDAAIGKRVGGFGSTGK